MTDRSHLDRQGIAETNSMRVQTIPGITDTFWSFSLKVDNQPDNDTVGRLVVLRRLGSKPMHLSRPRDGSTSQLTVITWSKLLFEIRRHHLSSKDNLKCMHEIITSQCCQTLCFLKLIRSKVWVLPSYIKLPTLLIFLHLFMHFHYVTLIFKHHWSIVKKRCRYGYLAEST